MDATQTMRSAFAAKQLLFAHAAITDVQGQKLLHDQRVARAGFGVAEASEADTAGAAARLELAAAERARPWRGCHREPLYRTDHG